MGFFAEFNFWLETLLRDYIQNFTAQMARSLEPTVVTLGVFYIVIWGYLQLTGKIEEPFVAGVKRLLTLALILGVSLQAWLYNELIVDTFFDAPVALAADIVGDADPSRPAAVGSNSVAVVDEIFFDGDDAASLLLAKGGFFNDKFGFYIAAFAVYVIVGLTAVYTMFLLALSKIALSVLIAMGPIFLALLFFESTKRFFEAWMAAVEQLRFSHHSDGARGRPHAASSLDGCAGPCGSRRQL